MKKKQSIQKKSTGLCKANKNNPCKCVRERQNSRSLSFYKKENERLTDALVQIMARSEDMLAIKIAFQTLEKE